MLVEGFRTVRLEAFPLAPPDAEPLRRLTDTPSITGRIDFLASPFTAADAAALIARNGEHETFLGLHNGFTLVGVVGAHREARGIEVGYWIGEDARGKGYASEALRGLVAWLRIRCGGEAILAECAPENAESRSVLRAAGFVDTGETGRRSGRSVFRQPG